MILNSNLYTLVKDLIGSEALVFTHQNSSRPALPYWTIHVSVQNMIGHDSLSQGVDNGGDLTISGVREATVQIQRVGNGSDRVLVGEAQRLIDNSDTLVADLRDNLSKPSVQRAWSIEKIAIFNRGNVQYLPYKIDEHRYEYKAILDLFIRFGVELLDNAGIIETVEIDEKFSTSQTPEFIENVNLSTDQTVVL